MSHKEQSKPDFILFGDVRIKRSNIKNYGISTFTRYYEKIVVWEGESFKDMKAYKKVLSVTLSVPAILLRLGAIDLRKGKYVWKGGKKEISEGTYHSAKRNGERGYFKKELHYLYVTTYQKDNYQFKEDEVSFDIFEKCKELDSLLT